MPRNRLGRLDILRWHHQANLSRDDSNDSDSDSDSTSSSDSNSERSVSSVSIHFDDSDDVNSGEENHSAATRNISISGDSDDQTEQTQSDSAPDSDASSSSSLLSIPLSNGSRINPAAVESEDDNDSVHNGLNSSNNSSISGDPSAHSDSDDGDAIVSNLSFGSSYSSQRSFGGAGLINPRNLNFEDSDDSDSNRSQNSPIIGLGARERDNLIGLGNLLRDLNSDRLLSPVNFGESPEEEANNNSEEDEDSLEDEAVVFPSRVMTGTSVSRTSAAVSSGANTISYECSVCLENLDQPASIDDYVPNAEEDSQDSQDANMPTTVRHLILRRSRASGVRGGGRGGLTQRNASANQPAAVSMTDVVATHCGHLYHQVCLEKWFQEQGRRTCPSCRKSIPKTKNPIRLYPNISMNSGSSRGQQNENENPLINPGTSGVGTSNPANPSPSTSSGISLLSNSSTSCGSSARMAAVAENPVINVIEDGDCAKLECQDLKVIHNTLINDYNELQIRFTGIRENEELKEAQIQSLEEDNTRLVNENHTLKRQIQEAAAPARSSSSAPKRRRH